MVENFYILPGKNHGKKNQQSRFYPDALESRGLLHPAPKKSWKKLLSRFYPGACQPKCVYSRIRIFVTNLKLSNCLSSIPSRNQKIFFETTKNKNNVTLPLLVRCAFKAFDNPSLFRSGSILRSGKLESLEATLIR